MRIPRNIIGAEARRDVAVDKLDQWKADTWRVKREKKLARKTEYVGDGDARISRLVSTVLVRSVLKCVTVLRHPAAGPMPHVMAPGPQPKPSPARLNLRETVILVFN
ncbi:hypothetical protein Scep_024789 [Stephania cephalantha]|uniref:Uncharacterized protein n=1 Tax=Stephania cephalantha TaxID=152367 RepID=A0AAP0EXX9_9MAGN